MFIKDWLNIEREPTEALISELFNEGIKVGRDGLIDNRQAVEWQLKNPQLPASKLLAILLRRFGENAATIESLRREIDTDNDTMEVLKLRAEAAEQPSREKSQVILQLGANIARHDTLDTGRVPNGPAEDGEAD